MKTRRTRHMRPCALGAALLLVAMAHGTLLGEPALGNGSSQKGSGQVARCLDRGFAERDGRIALPAGNSMTAKDVYRAIESVQYKNPRYYASVRNAVVWVNRTSREAMWVDVRYYGKAERKRVERAVATVLAWIHPKMSQLQKIQVIHDRIILSCDYCRKRAGGGRLSPRRFTAYGCLVDGKAVCSGYAKAFQLVARYAGVDALYASSGKHAWNMVRAGKRWYHLDAAWDDAGGRRVSYRYFMRGCRFMTADGHHTLKKSKPFKKAASARDCRIRRAGIEPFASPPGTRVTRVVAVGRDAAVVYWKRAERACGYEIRCASSKEKLGRASIARFRGGGVTSARILNASSHACVQVRVMKRMGGYVYKGRWSKPRAVK